MLLLVRAWNALSASWTAARGRRGIPGVGLAVRLEAMVIASLILTGLTVVIATEPAPLAPAAQAGVVEPGAPRLVADPARTEARGRPAAVGTVAAAPPGQPAPAPKPPAKAPARKRWLPTGTGMWTYLWQNTEGGNAKAVVAKAQRMGISHLFVRTGTRKGGFDGGPVLDQLLPATRGTDIRVIAWDFPQLRDPYKDARRLAAAVWHRPPGKDTPRVAAVAPDIETASEGTRLSTAAVEAYYKELRFRLPKNVAILATIPWPSEHRIGKYPFATTAKYADALVPMAYWINRNPVTVTRQTMARLRGYKKPIMPAGQAYDPRIDVPTLKFGAPSKAQVDSFFRAARAAGAKAASLWVWNTASPQHWLSIKQAAPLFDLTKQAAARPAPARPATPTSRVKAGTEPTPVRKPREPRQAQRAE